MKAIFTSFLVERAPCGHRGGNRRLLGDLKWPSKLREDEE